MKCNKTSWDAEEFKEVYQQYSHFYRWMKEKVVGDPSFVEMLNEFTGDKLLQMKIRVAYEVVQVQRRHRFEMSSIKRVTLHDGGRVEVEV